MSEQGKKLQRTADLVNVESKQKKKRKKNWTSITLKH